MGMRPVIVASPSMKSIQARINSEMEKVDEDITKYFDSSKGLHKAKSVRKC